MTAPSVADVMRSVSSRAPSMRCVGASDEMIQLSTTEPMLEPMLVATLVLVSIGATLYATLHIGLQALEWDALAGISTSLYYQLLAVVSLREFRIDGVNFEVYREDPMATALE